MGNDWIGNTDTDLSQKREAIVKKGCSDIVSAILKLIRVQTNIFLYTVSRNTSDMNENSKAFQLEIANIAEALSEINQISSKTRILSINASIEAARAGELGKGFAVVAKEVGNLSTQTTHCTAQVSDINTILLQSAESNRHSLNQLHDCMTRFNDSSNILTDVLLKMSIIENNGFILSILAKRLEDHANFMLNLLKNAGKMEHMSDHHTCAFGKWYDTHRSKYQHLPEYEDMYATHETFHKIAIRYNSTLDINVLVELLICSNDILMKFVLLAEAFKNDLQKNDDYFNF